MGIVGKSACIHEPEIASAPVSFRKVTIASSSCFLADDRVVLPDDAVEQRRLSNIRPANDCNDRNVHAATRPGSPASASAKSYDGWTGIGSSFHRSSKRTSSRKTP